MGGPIALVDGRVFDCVSPQPYSGCIVVEDGRIVDVGRRGEVEIPGDARVIDLGGRTVIPGLIDAHLHITGFKTGDIVKEPLITPLGVFFARAVGHLGDLLNAGFTTVCDAGGIIGLHLKYAVEEGSVAGPRIVAAGPVLTQTFGHGDAHYLPVEWVDVRTTKKLVPFASLVCDGVDECRKAARYSFRMGADFIKIMTTGGVLSEKDRPEYVQFTLDEIRAIVEEAEHVGSFVYAHAQGAKGIKNALQAGVRVIAHAIYMDEEGFELAKDRGAIIVPTLSIVEKLLEVGRKVGIPEWGLKKSEEVHQAHLETVRKAYKAGVKIAAGTDFVGGPFPMGENALELRLLVEKVGVRPEDAIMAATRTAAQAAGLADRLGTLEVGKIADMIVVEGDPLSDIGVLSQRERIVLVMKEGTIYKNTVEED